MYQVVVKNVTSRQIKEVIVEAECQYDIYRKFENPGAGLDDQYIVLFIHPIEEIQSIHELVMDNQPTFINIKKG